MFDPFTGSWRSIKRSATVQRQKIDRAKRFMQPPQDKLRLQRSPACGDLIGDVEALPARLLHLVQR